jgi:hypothetical protein
MVRTEGGGGLTARPNARSSGRAGVVWIMAVAVGDQGACTELLKVHVNIVVM